MLFVTLDAQWIMFRARQISHITGVEEELKKHEVTIRELKTALEKKV